MSRPTLFLLVGLPGSGKTTRARELESEHRAVRFSPDEWMIPLFGESEAGNKRDVLEGRLIATALQLLRLGVSVVLDFGFWSRDERSALRSLARTASAASVVDYLAVDPDEQWRRIETRSAAAPESTFPLTRVDLAGHLALFEPPDEHERAGGRIPEPPAGSTWLSWAASRWPSLIGS